MLIKNPMMMMMMRKKAQMHIFFSSLGKTILMLEDWFGEFEKMDFLLGLYALVLKTVSLPVICYCLP